MRAESMSDERNTTGRNRVAPDTKDDDTTYTHALKYTGLFGGIQMLTLLVNLIRNKITVCLLGPNGVALAGIYNNAVQLVEQSTNFGISFSAVKYMAELAATGDRLRVARYAGAVRTWSLLTAIFGTIACLVLAPWLSRWTFSSTDYTTTFMLLSPIVGILALCGGELAILKGTKQLRKVATVSAIGAVSTLIICSPIYLWLGIRGIVPALLLSNLAFLLIQLRFSTRVVPWHLTRRIRRAVSDGLPMLGLGVAYIIAGIFGQGAEYIIRTQILRFGELADVGFYNTGYAMAVSYASMVFGAIEADYFPRLSAAGSDPRRQNIIVNRQIEVCVLLIAPCLILFALAMPFFIVLLNSHKFLVAAPMAICATYYMFFKALTLPVAYLPLARGDSKMYMLTELIYDIFIACAIPLAFHLRGLTGAGWALSAGGLLNMLVIYLLYHFRYGYRADRRPLRFYALQFLLLTTAVFCALQTSLLLKWTLGTAVLLISLRISFRILNRETAIVQKIRAAVHSFHPFHNREKKQ